MARRVAAEMLAHLDRQSEAGLLAKPEYEAKRTEVLEMIRTGRDVDMAEESVSVGSSSASSSRSSSGSPED